MNEIKGNPAGANITSCSGPNCLCYQLIIRIIGDPQKPTAKTTQLMESATKITEKIWDVDTGKSGKRDSFHSLMVKGKMLPM